MYEFNDTTELEVEIVDLYEKVKKDESKIKRIEKRINLKRSKLSILEKDSKEYLKLEKSIEIDRMRIKDIRADLRYNNKKLDSKENELVRKNFLNDGIDFI